MSPRAAGTVVAFALSLAATKQARADDPLPTFTPSQRIALRAGGGGVFDRSDAGAFFELSGLYGRRITTEWSLAGLLALDLGGWSVSQGAFLLGGELAAGADYTARHALGAGRSWQLGCFAGGWMASATCDRAASPRCGVVMPAVTISWGVLPESGYDPVGPLFSWALGVSATAGYTTSVGEIAERASFYAGVEWF